MTPTDTPAYFLHFAGSDTVHALGILTAMMHAVLASRLSMWCWLAGFLSAMLYTIMFFAMDLTLQVVLNSIYMLVAVWGWTVWTQRTSSSQPSAEGLWSMTWRQHASVITVWVVLTQVLASLFHAIEPGLLTFTESLLMWGSLVAAIMTVYRILESWWYWLVVNALSAFHYGTNGEWFAAALFIAFLPICVYGAYYWRRGWRGELEHLNVE
ncbi:nicotinamide riboside transporter PnuC [Aestuariibacter halophilus]|uniref:Nicotinamide riboside transporter PnuC n=1 Tax=Fluctibacter halophilus TaxID=226011 RepID=A0ABS8G7Y7_9ALTE|nr:nicotinamide riboside transporter PnuC [Aestuariibacter halophilus]MCC2616687.1 nicotinamide riboside transporter PnuC [Aestuariibacter halophilus]